MFNAEAAPTSVAVNREEVFMVSQDSEDDQQDDLFNTDTRHVVAIPTYRLHQLRKEDPDIPHDVGQID